MSPPLPISVCLIVKNEAPRLRQSLPPFAGRVAEILAYDSGSTDDSMTILQQAGAKVVTGPWLGFAPTRRAIWSQATQPWILWLDADEIFSAATVEAMSRYFADGRDLPAGFRVRRQVVFQGQKVKHGDWDRDWVLRIFRRDNYRMDERLVHESVSVEGPVVRLPGLVYHDSIRSWDSLQARSQVYRELWARQALRDNRPDSSPRLRALWAFCRGYLIRSGWLDGRLGLHIALHNAREVFHKYRLLRQLRHNAPPPSQPSPAQSQI